MPIFVASSFIPKNGAKWPVLEDVYLRGGIRVVANAAARDATYADSNARQGLKTGMLLVTADNKKLWQYDGLGVWTELKKSSTKTFSFSIPGMVWDIPHNTGSTNFNYTVFDVDGFQILPNECQILDVNNLRLTFLEAVAGTLTATFNV